MKSFLFAALLGLVAVQAFAEDGTPGAAARQCETRAADEVAAIQCYETELEEWDARLNTAYGAAMQGAQANDAREDLPAGARNAADALREMQRAWIAYRDGLCGLDRAGLTPSNTQAMAWTKCRLQETARQTGLLEGAAERF
ncbi:lysozyme inhibitor LprI family protein [Ruegeria sp. 2012CJ41-6]|uniref:Lysozyme inhibitor LprI family protein n=1 Tax=Ruegeria spongiae TaxID=2942209 RepID=A0ABT0Q2G1_9RHOB|nr:lysozyme inhibitor LprI family protein [Ruegeria spongiae]MCL6283333.1 lysozyme inhibitor LprI family protein [Ruegeria spongiae]